MARASFLFVLMAGLDCCFQGFNLSHATYSLLLDSLEPSVTILYPCEKHLFL